MATVIKLKRSTTASAVPTTGDLADGEVAVNVTDKKVFMRSGDSIITVANFNEGSSVDLSAIDQDILPDTTETYDLGSTSFRWRNVYTNDLHLSNEGHSNEVDGTWGNWTIQEGESDLFLKNNRSGKKYKFNLTEVS